MLNERSRMRKTFGVGFLVAALACAPAVAQEGSSLSIGDKIPDVDIAHFLKGEPIKNFKEKTFVLEFWATW